MTAEKIDKTEVFINPIPQDSTDELIREGGVFHTAGGLMIEHPLVSPHIQRIVGSEDAVRGLSIASTMEVLLHVKQTSTQ